MSRRRPPLSPLALFQDDDDDDDDDDDVVSTTTTPEEIDNLIDRALSPSSSLQQNDDDDDDDDDSVEDGSDLASFLSNRFQVHREMILELKQKYRESVLNPPPHQHCGVLTTIATISLPPPSSTAAATATNHRWCHHSTSSREWSSNDEGEEGGGRRQRGQDSAFSALYSDDDEEEELFFDVVDVTNVHGMKEQFYDCYPMFVGQTQHKLEPAVETSIVDDTNAQKETPTVIVHDDKGGESQIIQQQQRTEVASFRQVELDTSIRHDDPEGFQQDGPPVPSMDDSDQRLLDQFATDDMRLEEQKEDSEWSSFDVPDSLLLNCSQQLILADDKATEGLFHVDDDDDKELGEYSDSRVLSLGELIPDEMESSRRRPSPTDTDHESAYLESEIDDILDNMDGAFHATDYSGSEGICEPTRLMDANSAHSCDDSSRHSDFNNSSSFAEPKSPEQPPSPESQPLDSKQQEEDEEKAWNDFLAQMGSGDEARIICDDEVSTRNETSEHSQVIQQEYGDFIPTSVVSSTSSRSCDRSDHKASASATSDEHNESVDSSDAEDDDLCLESLRDDLVSVASSEVPYDASMSSLFQEIMTQDVGSVICTCDPQNIDSVKSKIGEAPTSETTYDLAVTMMREDEIVNIVSAQDGSDNDSVSLLSGLERCSEDNQKKVPMDVCIQAPVISTKYSNELSSAKGPTSMLASRGQLAVGIGGETSVFSASVPNVVSNTLAAEPCHTNSPQQRYKDVIHDSYNTIPHGTNETFFAPLHESKSRITSPDLNISSTLLEEVDASSTNDSSLDAERPHDPVASALSIDLQVYDVHAGSSKREVVDGENLDKTSFVETASQKSTPMAELLSEAVAGSPCTEDARVVDTQPPSPPRTCRQTELSTIVATLHETPPETASPRSKIPSFDQNSVSTMSGSPISPRVLQTGSSDEQELSCLELPALDERNDREESPPKGQQSPEGGPQRLQLSAKQPHSETPRKPKKTLLQYDRTTPFSNINRRMDTQKHHYQHVAATPHLVPTSRSPFRGEAYSACRSIFSSGDKSTLRSLRGYYSLASPPRTPASPPVAIVSRTPRDTPNPLSPAMAATPKSPYHQSTVVCTNKFTYNLHSKMGPCDRCWALAGPEEQSRFEKQGSHLRIVRTRGGCGCSCRIFPPKRNLPARLCRQCFFATHKLDGTPVQVYRGNHVKVKLTT